MYSHGKYTTMFRLTNVGTHYKRLPYSRVMFSGKIVPVLFMLMGRPVMVVTLFIFLMFSEI